MGDSEREEQLKDQAETETIATCTESDQGNPAPTFGEIELPIDPEEPAAVETATPPSATDLTQAIALQQELTTLRNQLEEQKSLYLRLAADFDNYRKRSQREQEEVERRAVGNVIERLLPVVDDFERARALLKPQTDQEISIHKSYQGIYKQLVESLKKLGVAPINAKGQPFDPNYHEAVLREPSREHPEGTVLEELRRGYLMEERVLRHAMVKVAGPPETDGVNDAEDRPAGPVLSTEPVIET
ncbi:MAG: nucleotide exchange factor GrpE [Gloeomargaritaceae cyanobacterium C42_A2020_066]|nr:nucleotide exchange factor GrpE [Gloeomargaritaceae cyanobacterium C42_A2020_066]